MVLKANKKVLSAVTTGNGELDLRTIGGRRLTAYIIPSAGTISTGKVQIETASEPGYTGTWAAVGSEATLASGVTQIVQADGPFAVVRARVSTDVTGTGGNVSVVLVVV